MAEEAKKGVVGRAVDATWEGTKAVGRAVRENPVGAVIGGTIGFVFGGPVGAVVGVGAGGWTAKKIEEKEGGK